MEGASAFNRSADAPSVTAWQSIDCDGNGANGEDELVLRPAVGDEVTKSQVEQRPDDTSRCGGYASPYPSDFTLCACVGSDAATKLSKIVNGESDWLFYGHARADETGIDPWRQIDLKAFRAALIRQSRNGYPIRFGARSNADGTWFSWFDIRSFPADPPLNLARGRAHWSTAAGQSRAQCGRMSGGPGRREGFGTGPGLQESP